MTGIAPGQETVRWQQLTLRMGDRIRIKIVETKTADKYDVIQQAPRDARKYEKAWVRAMAKEFGWTIQRGPRKTQGSKASK